MPYFNPVAAARQLPQGGASSRLDGVCFRAYRRGETPTQTQTQRGYIVAGVNKVILIGNLGKDPEVRATTTGQRVANFSLATSRSWTGQDGQRQEKTEWHSIVVWGKLAEICEKYLQKGKQVYIEGRIETRSWQDKEGQTKYKTEIICEQMTMLGRAGGEKNGGDDKSGSEGGYDAPRGSAPKDESYEPAGNVPDDDLPF